MELASDSVNVHGVTAIRDRVSRLDLKGSQVDLAVGSMDAQASDNDCVLLCVTGHVSPPNSSVLKAFIQTFVLARQEGTQEGKKAYFVRNSVFRIVEAPESPKHVQAAYPTPAVVPVVLPAAIIQEVVKPVAPVVVAPVVAVPEPPKRTPPPVVHDGTTVNESKQTSHVHAPAAVVVPVAPPVILEPPVPTKSEPKSYADMAKRLSGGVAVPAPSLPKKAQTSVPPAVNSGVEKPAAKQTKKQDNGPPKTESKPMVPSLYVNQLEEGVTELQLKSLFSKFGKIKNIDLHPYPKGYAFVEYDEGQKCVTAALEACKTDENLFAINGKRIHVEEKSGKPKEKSITPRANGGSGGSGTRSGGGGERPGRKQDDGKKKEANGVSNTKDRKKDNEA